LGAEEVFAETVLDKDILTLLVRRFGEAAVFRTTIGLSVRMREATVRGLTVFELPEADFEDDD
jgi:hypothetical protein